MHETQILLGLERAKGARQFSFLDRGGTWLLLVVSRALSFVLPSGGADQMQRAVATPQKG